MIGAARNVGSTEARRFTASRSAMIYVVHPIRERNVDITPALCWGELRFINKQYLFADDLDDDHPPQPMLDALQRCAEVFNPKTDFVLIAGDHAQLIIFSAMLAVRHPYFRMLRYDRQAQAYYPVRVPGSRVPLPA